VWRAGARFDGWEEVFDLERWQRAFDEHHVDIATYLGTRPITARLPWDHIDVGLEDGFLLGEYRKAMKGRASPPCGKVAGMLIHHTNLEDASPDRRKLVCYDCGVACDLTKMRDDRLVALRGLHADVRPEPRPPVTGDRETERADRVREAGYHGADLPYSTYRMRFAKVGRAAFLGHLDLVRLLARSFRRADLPLAMTRGFSPKPRISFGPALGLGIPSLGELVDIDLEHVPEGMRSWQASAEAPRLELSADEVRDRLAAVCPPGIEIQECAIVRLAGHPVVVGPPLRTPDPGLGKLIDAVDVLIRPAPDGIAYDAARLQRIAAAFLAKPTAPITREKAAGPPTRADAGANEKKANDRRFRNDKPSEKTIDVRAFVTEVDVIDGDAALRLSAALDWPVGALLRVRIKATTDGSAKPTEVARVLGVWGSDELRGEHALIGRLGVVSGAGAGAPIMESGPRHDHAIAT